MKLSDEELESFLSYAEANREESDGSQCQWADYTLRLIEEVKFLREKLHETQACFADVCLAAGAEYEHYYPRECMDFQKDVLRKLRAQVESIAKERDDFREEADLANGKLFSLEDRLNAADETIKAEEQKLSAFRKDVDKAFERLDKKLSEVREFVRPTLDFHSPQEVKIVDAIRGQFREERDKLQEGR